MALSLRLLRVFLAVSQEGHIGRAAAALYVSQPSLSQDIRRLERDLGVQLFVREPRGMSLTPAGRAFRCDVEDALTLLDRSVERARAAGVSGRQRVVIGFSPSLSHRLMPSLIPALESRLAHVSIDEREVDTGTVNQGVRTGAFHIGMGHCLDAEEGLTLATILYEPLSVALALSHPLTDRGGGLSLAELEGLPIMLWARDLAPRYHDNLLDICRKAGLEPRIVEGPRRAIIRSYQVSEGKVFCLLPRSTSILSIPGVCFVDVVDEHANVSLDAIRRERPELAEIKAVWDAIIEEGNVRTRLRRGPPPN